MKILAVDDDEISLDLLAMTLISEGYDVVTAPNGDEAYRIIQEDKVRMVISDWMMPVMDGPALCRRIRSEPQDGYIYFIMLTSQHGDQATVEAFSAGADDYIVKPFNPAELLMRVKVGERIHSLETRHVTIFALAKLAESRDPETGHHLERIRDYARVLAQRLTDNSGITGERSSEFVKMIYLTSPLHDIGKVGIPDCVLLKPGRLSDSEFTIMKSHTEIGASTLEAALKQYPQITYLRMARDITLSHHERYDGNGYPHGLRGEDIPFSARIVALADVYDALTSKRVYKDAFTHEIARNIIVQESGSHFDPAVVEAFLQAEAEFITIREQYPNGG